MYADKLAAFMDNMYPPSQGGEGVSLNNGTEGECVCVCVRVCVIPFILDVRFVDIPAGVTQEEGHTGFFIHLLSAVLALIFLARRIQPFLALVDRASRILCTNDLIVLHLLGVFFFVSVISSLVM